MAHAIRYADYRFADSVDLMQVAERLSGYGDLSTSAALGVRFEPTADDWPATYFGSDGSIHVVARRARLEDLIGYMDFLSEVVGMDIIETTTRH